MPINEIIGRDDIAALLRVDPRTVNGWVKNGMPQKARGKYVLSECVQWYMDRMATDRGGGALEDERKKLVIQQRKRVELDNAARRGELVPVDDVADLLNRVGVILATQLDGLGARSASKLATLSDPVILQRCLLDETRHIRSAISTEFTTIASDRITFADSRTAAGP